jgi:outer membrane protein assembly factor BamB
LIRYKITKTGNNFSAAPLWTNPQMKINISTSVLVDGKLYGIGASQGQSASEFACVDFETGATLWKKAGFADYASTAALGDRLLVLNATGELFLLAADPSGYKELGRMQPCGKTYSFPAYSNGVLYVRDDKSIRALPMIELP